MGYQVALFVQRAATVRIVANRDRPDTVYVVESPPVAAGREKGAGGTDNGNVTKNRAIVRKAAPHTAQAEAVYRSAVPRRVESFRFNPNTASLDDFKRLGFSEKQAQSILNYREKGGKFRRKSDFAKSFVVPGMLRFMGLQRVGHD